MIGQENLLKQIDNQISENTFPRFVIIEGAKGSGKKLIVDYIEEKIEEHIGEKCTCIEFGSSVASVRDAIHMAYKTTSTAVFSFPDADSMTGNAKNALLKVTEEPPNHVYFVMTLEDKLNTLETIRSRGTVFTMDKYTPKQLVEYANCESKEEENIIIKLCETPGEVNLLKAMGVESFYAYVDKVFYNIAEVSGANAFKIADKIALTDDEGYDLKLFWKAFVDICGDKLKEEKNKELADVITITSRYLQDLRINGINKKALFDLWILDVRGVLL